MNIVSNNIANMNTPGFKAEHALQIEDVIKQDVTKEDLSFVEDYGQYMNTQQGPMEFTSNDLDMAMEGPGFFAIERNGQTYYSRAGNFKINDQSMLVNAAGLPVLDEGEGTIEIPDNVKHITVSDTGMIIGDDQPIAQLMIAEFDNVNKLDPRGGTLYATDQKPAHGTATRVVQGALEKSNVNGVLEMTDMIEISRQYQSTARILQNEHDRVRQTIKTLSQVQA